MADGDPKSGDPPSTTVRQPSSVILSDKLAQWPGSRRSASRSSRRPSKAGCPKGCGSSARPARRSSTTRISRPACSVCPKCGHHFRMSAAERLRMLFDGAWTEHDADLQSTDPLKFTDTKPYRDAPRSEHRGDRHEGRGDLRHRTHRRHRDRRRRDGVRLHRRQHGRGRRREDHPAHRARDRRGGCRSIIVSCSGGARMMEGRAVADADGEDQRARSPGSIARGCPTSRS